MHPKKHMRTLLLLVIFFCTVFSPAWGQSPNRIQSINVEVISDSLFCRYQLENVFSEKVRKTLLSGLPVLIHLNWKLYDQNQNLVSQTSQQYRLTFDIWEDRFEAANFRQKFIFSSLDTLIKYWQQPRKHFIAPLAALNEALPYQLNMDLTITLLSRKEEKLLREWLLNPDETEKNLPGGNRETGFVLDLSRFFSVFFRGSSVIEQISHQKAIGPFYLNRSNYEDNPR